MSLAVSLCANSAKADGATEAPPRHVEIKIVAPHEDHALEVVVSELLERLQVSMTFSTAAEIDGEEMWRPHEGAPAAVARAWIDLRELSQVTIYLTGDKQDRVLVRQVPLVPRFDEVAREEVAHIVEAAVDELLMGGQIGVEKKHAPEPRRVALPPPLPEPPLRLDIGFGYAAQGWAKSQTPLHGPAAVVALAKSKGPWRPGVSLSGEIRFPQQVDRYDVRLGFDQGAIRLLFISDTNVSARWTLRGGIGGGIDWVKVSPSALSTNVTPEDAALAIVPMLRASATATYAFTTKSEFFLGLAADVDLSNPSYYKQNSPSKQTIIDPWMIRPTAVIGIAADVLAY